MNNLKDLVLNNEPTIMDGDRVIHYLGYVMDNLDNQSKTDISEVLMELLFKLSDSFTDLPKSMATKIYLWIEDAWEDEEMLADYQTSILLNLPEMGSEVVSFLKLKLDSSTDRNVKRILNEAILEVNN